MKVRAVFTSVLRTIVGEKEVEINLKDDATIEDLVNALGEKYGDKVKEYIIDRKTGKPKLSFVVNGKAEPLEKDLEDGDRIIFMIIMGGG